MQLDSAPAGASLIDVTVKKKNGAEPLKSFAPIVVN
jgi:hypothetical protein